MEPLPPEALARLAAVVFGPPVRVACHRLIRLPRGRGRLRCRRVI